MQPIEIITIIFALTIVLGVFGNYLYKKITHKPTGDCALCSKKMKKTIKKIKKIKLD